MYVSTFCPCTWTCACWYTCTFECLSVETAVQCGIIALHPVFGNGFSLSFEIPSRLDNQRALGICLPLCISALALHMHVATLGFYMGADDPNSGSHTLFSRHCACWAISLAFSYLFVKCWHFFFCAMVLLFILLCNFFLEEWKSDFAKLCGYLQTKHITKQV